MNTSQSIIPQSDDRLFSYFLKETFLSLFSSGGSDPQSKKRDDRLLFILLGLILIIATEPLKVLLRKNIGKLSLSMPRLVSAVVLYLLWAVMMFALAANGKVEPEKIAVAFIIVSVLYLFFAVFILVLGVKEYFLAEARYKDSPKDTLRHLYRGDSVFFKKPFNEKEQKKLWMITEPKYCLFAGLILTIVPAFIHPALALTGAPIIVTSLSFWFNEVFQVNNVWDAETKKIIREREKNTQKQQFYGEEKYSSVKYS